MRRKDRQVAIAQHRCSRVWWLAVGDAPSRYFFVRMKAKQLLETIWCLTREGGSLVEGEDTILEEVGNVYEEIYAIDPQVELHAKEFEQVLNLITRQLTIAEQTVLDRILEAVKIEETMKQLPNNKSSGLDGIIAEVLRKCWVWVQEDCVEVIHAFWSNGRLTPRTIKGVIHLIPKVGEPMFLRNWRPITLMTLL